MISLPGLVQPVYVIRYKVAVDTAWQSFGVEASMSSPWPTCSMRTCVVLTSHVQV